MRRTKTINIAPQGGGAHGAFAWGVLDRVLEEPSIEVEGVVGTSSGAMNAAVAAYGLTVGEAFLDAYYDELGRIGSTRIEERFL